MNNLCVNKEISDHKIMSFNTSIHKFIEYFQTIFETDNLQFLHLNCSEYKDLVNGKINDISDIETELHKTFYKSIKENNTFKMLYCNIIRTIYNEIFPDQEYLIYQSFPSIRFQFPNSVAVPPHCDSDSIGRHPLGEKNFLLPITKMHGSKRIFIERTPTSNDFVGIDLDYGDLFYFNGNKCIHYNEKNIENSLRISLDFRIILPSDYKKYIMDGNITFTNPRDPDKKRIPIKMTVGDYYQITNKNDSIEKMLEWHFQKKLLLQSRPVFDINEADACYNYMKDDNFVTEFKYTEMLETQIANFINVKHCILTTSGNIAIILALMASNISNGDEVIVPNYTMIASINAIRMVGAKPIIIDVDNTSLTISLDTIKQHITTNTKAILHVSLNNRHFDIQSIQEYCKSVNILMIEDAAQSLGCFVNNKHFGTFGDIGCFSLSTPKIISTGQGGFVITNNDILANKMRMIKNFGRKEAGNDIFELFGINFKFTDIQAVIGIEQMKKLPIRIKRLREIFDLYYTNLSTISKMIKPQSDTWIPWFADIFIDNRENLMSFLKNHNIQTRATYPEINKTPMYLDDKIHINSNYISTHGLFLPTHMLLTNNEINYISTLIKLFFLK